MESTVAAISIGHSVEISALSSDRPTCNVLMDIFVVTISGHMKSFHANMN
ncbi:MAG: hypothetical protein BWY85_01585 [Firmicutes bacterium ADurb.Bin506]|nr:MAG: hypothetical protein BWY85_01585 [Firmicutes bacterium ADurb.Bin506]